ncbi:MAG: hypothetical protein WKG06_27230 [Segetibacter sp.]
MTALLYGQQALQILQRVAPVSGSIKGNVTVERFIPGRRSFRFLSPSVTTTTSIKD